MGDVTKDSKTYKNLLDAFAGESQANRKYTAYSRKADEEGYPEVAQLFRNTAEGETAHALGHLRLLSMIGPTAANLEAAVAGETYEYTNMYPEFAKIAREEGYGEVAQWFDILGNAENHHADKYKAALDQLKK